MKYIIDEDRDLFLRTLFVKITFEGADFLVYRGVEKACFERPARMKFDAGWRSGYLVRLIT